MDTHCTVHTVDKGKTCQDFWHAKYLARLIELMVSCVHTALVLALALAVWAMEGLIVSCVRAALVLAIALVAAFWPIGTVWH